MQRNVSTKQSDIIISKEILSKMFAVRRLAVAGPKILSRWAGTTSVMSEAAMEHTAKDAVNVSCFANIDFKVISIQA
jgi:hypothetical protein